MNRTLYIFDIDGTLTDSIPTYLKVITEVMKAAGLKDIDTDYDHYLHHTDRYAINYNWKRNYGVAPSKDIHSDLDTKLAYALSKEPTIIEIKGARKLLTHFIEKGIPFAFGTGAYPKATAIKMNDCKLPYHNDILSTSYSSITRAGFVKQAIDKAMKYYKIENFDKIVAVGDGVWDLKAAQTLRLDFIGIGKKNKMQMMDLGCDKWLPTMEGFEKFVE